MKASGGRCVGFPYLIGSAGEGEGEGLGSSGFGIISVFNLERRNFGDRSMSPVSGGAKLMVHGLLGPWLLSYSTDRLRHTFIRVYASGIMPPSNARVLSILSLTPTTHLLAAACVVDHISSPSPPPTCWQQSCRGSRHQTPGRTARRCGTPARIGVGKCENRGGARESVCIHAIILIREDTDCNI